MLIGLEQIMVKHIKHLLFIFLIKIILELKVKINLGESKNFLLKLPVKMEDPMNKHLMISSVQSQLRLILELREEKVFL